MSSVRALALAATLAATSCSPTPVTSYDQELAAIDLDACARGDAPCAREGNVNAASVVFSGPHEVAIGPGGAIDAPLNQPASSGRLAYLAVGLNTIGLDGSLEISIDEDPSTKTTLAPPPGLKRIEVDMHEFVSRPGAHLRLRSTSGTFEVTYLVGLWHVP